ncbi:hypothetical protein GCM10023152_34620 [Agromyces bauzanensis]|uniref:Uncharacterized protein n=1 Tax=Agromyces bauzanensis TaxID=1308924 RepID=A0A917PTR1_9MICO|nr:hypothetical protein GCM10011372_32350 [Agromyces bauzanensis]
MEPRDRGGREGAADSDRAQHVGRRIWHGVPASPHVLESARGESGRHVPPGATGMIEHRDRRRAASRSNDGGGFRTLRHATRVRERPAPVAIPAAEVREYPR